MKEPMEAPAPGDGVCGICQQPLAGQHWERWLPCGHAVHRSCASRQRRAETLCPCCRMDGKAQVGRRDVSQLQASALRLENCDQVARASDPCDTVSDEVASAPAASRDAWKRLLSGQCGDICPLLCIQSGDVPQNLVFFLLMKLVAERLHIPSQADGSADARDLQAFRRLCCGFKTGTSQWERVARALRNADSDDYNKASSGSFSELFEPSTKDEMSKTLNYKAGNCVNQLQNMSAWWSIETRSAKHNEPRSEAPTRRAGVRRRVPRRARARRRRSRQPTERRSNNQDQETEEEGVSGTAPAEPSPESQDEESTLDGLPELGTSEEVVGGNDAAEAEVENAHSDHSDDNQLQRAEESVEAEQNHIQADDQDLDEDNTDSDPDYAEPEGFETSRATLDDEESIAPVTRNRRIVDIEDSDYDEDTASDASDTTQDNGLHYYAQDELEGEQEDGHSDMLPTEDTRARIRAAEGDDDAGHGGAIASNAFAGSGASFWSNRESVWSSLCARVRGYLPPWRQSVQAVRNRIHQVTRPLEDIQVLASDGQREVLRNRNGEEPGTEMQDFSAHTTQRPETRRVRRRTTP